MKKIILSLVLSFVLWGAFPTASFAAEVKITVNGMVCSFCAQGIQKKFEENKDVEKIDVKLDDKLVTVTFKEGSTIPDDDSLTKTIVDAGYEVKGIERPE